MNRLLSTLLLAAVAGMAAGGYWGWQRYSASREWGRIRPPLPALLGSSAPGVDARLAAYAQQFEKSPPNVTALADFTRVCHANGQLDAAISGYQALIKLNPEEPRWPYRLASILAGYGRLDEALPHLRRTVQLAPDYVTARLKFGEALLKSNSTAEAEKTYREVLQHDEKNQHAMLGLARCDLQADRLTAARSQLQRTVATHPEFGSALSLLGSVLERLGNTEGAEIVRSKIQQGSHYPEPDDPWLGDLISDCHDPYTLLIAASAALAEGRHRDAVSLLNRGLTLAPENARLHRQLAKTHAALGDLKTARIEMEQAVLLEPTNDAIHLDLLSILRQSQDTAALGAAVTRGVETCPNSPALQFEAGLVASQSGKLEDAARFFESAWHNQPTETAAAYEAATAHFRRGKPESAVVLLEQVLARLPQESTAALMLLRYGIQSGDSRAAGWMQRTIAAEPPAAVLAELRQDYQRRFGVTP
jgi:tetratricopeptide (TPR) repeat protein